MKRMFLLGLCLIPLLTACANTAEVHNSKCKYLKSQIVFNAATSNTRFQEIDRSEASLKNHTYDQYCEGR